MSTKTDREIILKLVDIIHGVNQRIDLLPVDTVGEWAGINAYYTTKSIEDLAEELGVYDEDDDDEQD